MPDPKNNRPDWRTLHLWQIQPVRDGLLLAAVLGLLYLGNLLSVVTVPLLLALTLAYLLEPVIARLTRVSWISRQGAALGLIVVVALAVVVPVVVGGVVGVMQGYRLVATTAERIDLVLQSIDRPEDTEARDRLPEVWRDIRDYIVEKDILTKSPETPPADSATDAPKVEADATPVAPQADGEAAPETRQDAAAGAREKNELSKIIKMVRESAAANAETITKRVVAAGGGVLGAIAAFVVSMGKAVFGAFLTAFFFYFICTGYGKVLQFWESLIPERKRARAFDLLRQMDAVIAGFVRGRLTVCGVLIVVFTACFWFIGVPAPLIVGPILGLLTIVPYASSIAMPVVILIMWLNAGGEGYRSEWWWIIGAPLGVQVLTQFLDDYVLTPTIQGKSTNMDTPTILFASIAGGALAGIYGLLLAIPVAACIKILLRELFWPRFREWAQGKASDPLPIQSD